jgi:hypothetical protein
MLCAFFFLRATDRLMNHHFKCGPIHFWFFLYMISFSYTLSYYSFFKILCHILFIILNWFFFVCIPSFHFKWVLDYSIFYADWYRSYTKITWSFICFENVWRKLHFGFWMIVVSIFVCVLFFYVALIVFFWEHNLSFNENLTITIYWKSLHVCFLIHRYKRDQAQRKITKLQEYYMISGIRTFHNKSTINRSYSYVCTCGQIRYCIFEWFWDTRKTVDSNVIWKRLSYRCRT